jgi:HAD superfamily hydrolase (TIGR01549 family)
MFPDYETVGNESCAIIRCGNTGASRKNFEPIHVSSKTAARQRVNGHKGVINSGKYDVISFDVFDTLVCRTVLQPKDVFDLIAAGLSDEFGRELGTDFIDYFARNRAGVERKMRLELDRDDAAQVDELKIKDIYEEMLSIYELPLSLSQKLVEFEQEMEYSCLIPRPLGQELYYEALESGRKILIISDFVHPTSFVEEVLRRNGINNWDHIYVSSDIGKKKHSGELFDYVCDDLGLDRCKVIHFGDNSHGDVKMAKAKEIDARHLPSAPYLLSQIFTARKFNVGAIRQSIVTSAILCCHANRYCQAGLNRSSGSDSLELIADNEEFGFLVVGPLMHFFSKWILNQAKASNIQQVVFFARDTKIPYEMAQAATMRGASNLRVRYLPVSRVALSGVDIFAPEDLRKIRIDDFPKNKLLSELCEQRFLLHAEEVSLTELKKWVPGEFNEIQISSLPEMAIYEIAVQSARENWGVIEERLERKRSCFVKLMDQLDIDRSLPTIAVDIGYKGTIHRKVSPFFSDIFLPRFFMAYSNNLGKDPIENLEVFYRKDLVPQSRGDDPFLKYNLIFETLLNEGVESSMDYRINSDGEVDVVRDSAIDDQHSVIIKEIHRGALEFSAFWTNNCSSIDRHADWDQQMQSYLFSIIMSRPTALEAWMLSGLKFDNNYSGHRTKPLIDLLFKEVAIWNEGEKAVKGVAILNESTPSIKRGSKSQVQRPKLKVYESWRLMYAPIVRFFVVKMGRKKDVEKFDQNPSEFFKQLDDPKYNLIGRLLFP